MPNQLPSNAAEGLPIKPGEDATAAAVMLDEQAGTQPGRGSDAASGTTRNSPMTGAVPAEAASIDGAPSSGFAREQREALQQAASAPPAEPHPQSS